MANFLLGLPTKTSCHVITRTSHSTATSLELPAIKFTTIQFMELKFRHEYERLNVNIYRVLKKNWILTRTSDWRHNSGRPVGRRADIRGYPTSSRDVRVRPCPSQRRRSGRTSATSDRDVRRWRCSEVHLSHEIFISRWKKKKIDLIIAEMSNLIELLVHNRS